ncbi:MAG: YfhO family protein [Bacteroidales bacterium]|nr:YfhO family protein [Bacteroidales bacterium]
MNKTLLKKIGIALGILAFFLALSYGFVPQVLDGKIVNQSDISGYVGMSHEMESWNKEHPDNPTYWTDSMFGGMPTTAISTRNNGDYTQVLYDLLFTGKRPATYLFVALLGAFLLFLAFGVSWPLAVGGAIAIAFCSYNFQIIQVGHNTKMQAIALMPWVLAALVYTYRHTDGRSQPAMASPVIPGLTGDLLRTLLGAALFGLALSMQVKANHQQITYYLAIMVLLYAVAELVHVIRNGGWGRFLTASALLLVLGLAGVATNVNKLLPLAKYTPETMRGGSELSRDGGATKGLDLDYATAWSYGWEELPNMMIPDFNGGASAERVDPKKSETAKLLKKYGQKNVTELPLYWGPQPFTAGPMYMGAISIFLFILGLGLYKGREKWWLLAATVLAVLMAVGSHFMAFTALCFKYLPLYNKFRTVSMALVVLQVALPVLGFLTLDRIVREEYPRPAFMKAFWWALGVTGGFCLLCCLAPGMFGSFSGASDSRLQDILVDALIIDRIALFRHDAFISLLLIAASAGLLLWAYLPAGKKASGRVSHKWVAAVAICVLSLLNLFTVGKRYLNASHFTTPKDFNKAFVVRPVDQAILADDDPQYRVLDLTVEVFNSSVPSYHHKNVGGYSPAKLQRYQDLIEHYLTGEINGLYKQLNAAEALEEVEAWMASGTPVLNALNTRYVILDGNYPPLVNPYALGDAWFVDTLVPASSADEEIALLGSVDLSRQAVVRQMPGQAGQDGALVIPGSTGDLIGMTSYAPNELHYRYSTDTERVAVFSEIWYPNGWKATVDGEPVELFRADWTLRAALLPAGSHELVMTFLPDSYRVGAAISRWMSALLLLLTLAAACLALLPRRASK